MKVLLIIKTVLVFIIIGLSAVILMPFGLIFFMLDLLGLKKIARMAVYRIAQGWARLIIIYTGTHLKVSGIENIPKKGPLCVISNHCGIFDIALHLAYIGRPFGFIAKKELIYIPFINIWILLLGGFFMDRKNPRKGLATIEHGIRSIKKGGAMIIFPEGTRSRGQGVLPFKVGSFKMAVESNAAVVPAAITGSYELLEETGIITGCDTAFSFGEVIDSTTLPPENRRHVLSDEVYKKITALLIEQQNAIHE